MDEWVLAVAGPLPWEFLVREPAEIRRINAAKLMTDIVVGSLVGCTAHSGLMRGLCFLV